MELRRDWVAAVGLEALPRSELAVMADAGRRVLDCQRLLAKTDDSIVGEVLKGHAPFRDLDHYPPGDVYDPATHSQYYFHRHRDGEYGHFHLFLRSAGMNPAWSPAPQSGQDCLIEREDRICHLIAVSTDADGQAVGLFTTNRWVTAEDWYAAEDVIAMLDRFEMDVAPPSWPVNVWLTSLVRLFKPVIAGLIRDRDRVVADWQRRRPEEDVFENRDLEIPSEVRITVVDWVARIDAALARE